MAGVRSYFMEVSIEVRCKIAEKMETFRGLNNLCLAFPHLYPYVHKRLKVLNTMDMIRTVANFSQTDVKTIRLVSKQWKAGVDSCMRPEEANLSLAAETKPKYLITTIKLPLSRSDAAWILQWTQEEKMSVIGSGLRFELRDDGAINNPDMIDVAAEIQGVASAMAYILRRVRHLEITIDGFDEWIEEEDVRHSRWRSYETDFNGGLEGLFGPFLREMTKVVRVKLESGDCIGAAKFLPMVNQVEEISVDDVWIGSDDWGNFLQLCRPSLRMLDAPMWDETLSDLRFPRLSELNMGIGFLNYHFASVLPDLFPSLSVLKLNCHMSHWVFLAELTHQLPLRYVVAIVQGGFEPPEVPRRPLINAKKASDRLEKVVIYTHEGWQSKMIPYLFAPTTKIIRLPPEDDQEADQEYHRAGDDGNDETAEDYFNVLKQKGDLPKTKSDMIENVRRCLNRPVGLENIEMVLLRDLFDIAILINGPVMVSNELWMYVGGPLRLPFDAFRRVASMTLYMEASSAAAPAAMGNLFLEFEPHMQAIPVAMSYLFRRFGCGFYRGVDYLKPYLTDRDWNIIFEMFSSLGITNIAKMPIGEWKRVHDIGRIGEMSPLEIWEQFYSNVVTRIRDTSIMANSVLTTRLELDHRSREASITLYHSILVWTSKGVCEAILGLRRDHIIAEVIDVTQLDIYSIYRYFFQKVATKNYEYFVTTRQHFEFVQSEIFVLNNPNSVEEIISKL